MSISSTAIVNVVPAAAGPQPWIENLFDYADKTALLADRFNASSNPDGAWSAATEDLNTARMSLIAEGPTGGSGKSLRYTYPDNSAAPCHSGFSIAIHPQFPQNVAECWVEIYCRFSANFSTNVGALCPAAADLKFVFGRVNGGDRFEMKVGTQNGLSTASKWPNDPAGVKLVSNPSTVDYFDGEWHRWRMHMKVGAAGIFKCWFDNTLWRNSINQPITTATYIYGLALGRNMNEGPLQAQTLDWGIYRVYNTDPGW